MTYFYPKIYNKNNLKEKDRKELDYIKNFLDNVIENTKEQYEDATATDTILGRIQMEIVENFCEMLKVDMGFQLHEEIVYLIDGYEEDVEEVENPDTYYYEPKEDNEE